VNQHIFLPISIHLCFIFTSRRYFNLYVTSTLLSSVGKWIFAYWPSSFTKFRRI